MKENRLRALFIKLKILEVANNEERTRQGKKRLGRGYREAHRFNKFNPLTYIALLGLLLSVLACGVVELVVGLFDFKPFKWD